MSVSVFRELGHIRAMPGRQNTLRTAKGDLLPQRDKVVVYADLTWLKGGPLGTQELTPSEARKLAVELLQAAENVEERMARYAANGSLRN